MNRGSDSRPVSGEILTARPNREEPGSVSERDFVEAEYETVVGRHQKLSPDIKKIDETVNAPFGLEILSGEKNDPTGGKAGPLFWIAGALLIAVAFWISGGHTIVSDQPINLATASQNPLAIEGVSSKLERRGSNPYLLVEGKVLNGSDRSLPLPDLIIQVKASDGSITRYRIAGGEERILAYGQYAFSSRLGTPQSGIENVKVIIQDGN